MANEIVKEYSNGELTIVWKPKKCIHAAECVKHLPNVYDPKAKPWIKIGNATNEELIQQISTCPSGALSYYLEGDKQSSISSDDNKTKVEILKDGPILIHGKINIAGIDGNIENKKETTALCRCGASKNKPYCDGTHNKINFKG